MSHRGFAVMETSPGNSSPGGTASRRPHKRSVPTGTASGICFITIEDETGCANLVVFKDLFDKYRKEILQSTLLMVEGKLQVEGEVVHVIVKRCYNYSRLLNTLVSFRKEADLSTLSRADERREPILQKKKVPDQDVVQGQIFAEPRNFR